MKPAPDPTAHSTGSPFAEVGGSRAASGAPYRARRENRERARRTLHAWLALELGAAILALALLVALLPLVAIALPAYLGRTIPLWAVAVDVLAVSVPLAVILGAAALRLPMEVVGA